MRWEHIEIQNDQGSWISGEDAYEYVRKISPYSVWNYNNGNVVLNRSPVRGKDLISDPDEIQELLKELLGDGVRFTVPPPSVVPGSPPVRRHNQNAVDRKYKFRVSLQLGDIDALFEPVESANVAQPWRSKCIQQRLQVLGYLYVPLDHTRVDTYAEKSWEYYKGVHEIATNDELLQILKKETGNNILCANLPYFPNSGTVFDSAKLPATDEFAAIRIPGGYCMSSPPLGYWTTMGGEPDAAGPDAQYAFPIGYRRDEVIKIFWQKNEFLGKIPIIAYVEKRPVDESTDWEPAKRADIEHVSFRLVPPAEWTRVPDTLCAPRLRDKVINYAHDLPPDMPSPYDQIFKNIVGILDPPPGKKVKGKPSQQNWDKGKVLAHKIFFEFWNANLQANRKAVDDLMLLNKELARNTSNQQLQQRYNERKQEVKEARTSAFLEKLNQTNEADRDDAWWTAKWMLTDEQRGLAGKVDGSSPELRLFTRPPIIAGGPSTPEIDGGPKKFVDSLLAQLANETPADDPQRGNAPSKFGGKQSSPVAGVIFEAVARIRFNDGHVNFGQLDQAVAEDNYAVKAKINDTGYAGVIFMPSRCGGDRYKLRVFATPAARDSGPVLDTSTGTMVVWQNLRIHKILRHAPNWPNQPSANLSSLFTSADRLVPENDYGKTANVTWENWFKTHGSYVHTGAPDLKILLGQTDIVTHRQDPRPGIPGALMNPNFYRGPISPQTFISLADNLRKGFMELVADYDAPENVTQQQLDNAFRNFKIAFNNRKHLDIIPDPDKPNTPFGDIDLDSLVFVDASSPYLLNFRHLSDYNERIDGKNQTIANQQDRFKHLDVNVASVLIGNFAEQHGVQPLAEDLADGGMYPGITIIQATHGDTWDHNGFNERAMFTSGWAGTPRCLFVFYSQEKHQKSMCYSASSNVAHELGHVLMLGHQPPNPGGDEYMHEAQVEDAYSRPRDGETNCVMGYSGCYGEYCGRCVLHLRGWRLKQTKWRNPLKMDQNIGVETDGV